MSTCWFEGVAGKVQLARESPALKNWEAQRPAPGVGPKIARRRYPKALALNFGQRITKNMINVAIRFPQAQQTADNTVRGYVGAKEVQFSASCEHTCDIFRASSLSRLACRPT